MKLKLLVLSFLMVLAFPVYAQVDISGNAGVATIPIVSTTVPGATLTFNNQVINTSSSPQLATFVNTGGASAPITSVVSGDAEYALSSPATNSCLILTSIPPSGSCGVFVVFTPTSTGMHNSTLTLTSTGTAGSPVVVTLTGSGVNTCTSNCGGPNALTAGVCATVGATSACNWGDVGFPTAPPGYPGTPSLATEQSIFCGTGSGTNSIGQSITGAWIHTTTGGWNSNNETCGFNICGPAMMAFIHGIDSTFPINAGCLDNPDASIPMISYDGCYSQINTSGTGRPVILALTIPGTVGCSGSTPSAAYYLEYRGTPCGVTPQCSNQTSGGLGMPTWSRVEAHRLYGFCNTLTGGVYAPTPTLCGVDPTTGVSHQYINWQTVLSGIPLATGVTTVGGGYDCSRDTTGSGIPTVCTSAIARAGETQGSWSLVGSVNLNTGDTYVIDFQTGNIYATGAYAGGACTGCLTSNLVGNFLHGANEWHDGLHVNITLTSVGPVIAAIGTTSVVPVATNAGGGLTNGHRDPIGVGASAMIAALTTGQSGNIITALASSPGSLNYSVPRQGSGCPFLPPAACVPDQHNNDNSVDLNNNGLMASGTDMLTAGSSCPAPVNPGTDEIDYITWQGTSITVVNPPITYRVAPTLMDVCNHGTAVQNQYGGTASSNFYPKGGYYQKSTNWNCQSGVNDGLGGCYHFITLWNVF